jgi:hypothetical protein
MRSLLPQTRLAASADRADACIKVRRVVDDIKISLFHSDKNQLSAHTFETKSASGRAACGSFPESGRVDSRTITLVGIVSC